MVAKLSSNDFFEHKLTEHEAKEEFSFEDHIKIMAKEGDFDNLDKHKPNHWHKIMIVIIGLILATLIASYIFAGFPLSGIIRGQLESSPLENNIVIVDNITLVFEDSAKEVIEQYYFSEQETEFSLCLFGEKLEEDGMAVYHITDLYQPKQYQQTFNHVSFESCLPETLILLHTHPYKSCLASDTDINTLRRMQENNPDVLMLVMCEPARFSVYS
jgi:proteasome lid subunit RPN8/RPN11